MLKIPRQQVINRWDSLPDNLREALCSEPNADNLWQICEAQHIPKEKIYTVATLAGDVILGFLLSEDLAQEIRTAIGINPEIANAIAREIDRKIFAPIRSDLEKVYAPPVSEAERPIVSEIKKPEIRPAFAGQLDWRAGVPAGEPPIKIIEEESKTGAPAETPKTITLPAEGPLMIHEEIKFKPLAETKKSLGGLFEFLRGADKRGAQAELRRQEIPVRAQVEMGKQVGLGGEEKIQLPPKIEKVEDKEKKVGPIEIRPPENLPVKIKIEPVITIQELQPPKEEPLKTKKSIRGLLGFLKKKEGEKEKEMSPAKTPAETGKQAEIGKGKEKAMAIAEKETMPAPKIITEKTEPEPVSATKQPLGGLLKFLTRKKEVAKEIEPLSLEEKKVIPPEPPAVSRVEPPKVRVVNYTELEIKPPANLPIEKPLEVSPQPEAFQFPKIEIPKIEVKKEPEEIKIAEKKPASEEVPVPETEPVLDLRKAAEEVKPTPERPITPAAPPGVGKAEPEETIDLSVFK